MKDVTCYPVLARLCSTALARLCSTAELTPGPLDGQASSSRMVHIKFEVYQVGNDVTTYYFTLTLQYSCAPVVLRFKTAHGCSEHLCIGGVHIESERMYCCGSQRFNVIVEDPAPWEMLQLQTTLMVETSHHSVTYSRNDVNRLLGPAVNIIRAQERSDVMPMEAYVYHFSEGVDVCDTCRNWTLPTRAQLAVSHAVSI